MAAMIGFERQQWLAALLLLITALFVSAGLPLAARWRRSLKYAAIGLFLLAFAATIVAIARWLAAAATG
jgi:hypothetical protein